MPDPILNITFGDGTPNPGPALPPGRTTYGYASTLCPNKTEYTIARNNKNCGDWVPINRDHSFLFNESALEGYMMIINGYGPFGGTYFKDTVDNLCDNSTYLLSAAFGRLGNCGASDIEPPNIYFKVETLSGVLIASALPENMISFPALRFSNGFYFTLPAGESSVVITLMNRYANSETCGSKLYIDDIQLRPSGGPVLAVTFATTTDPVTSVCYQNNTSISIIGSIQTGSFANPAFQWQQSTDGGIVWTDIPGATGTNFTSSYSIPGSYSIRMRASEATVIANPNCSMVSNNVKVQVDGIPTDIKITNNSPVCAGQPLAFNAEGGASYVWTGPNGWTDNISYPQIYHTVLADSGTYYLEITTAGGCKATESIHATIIGTDIKAGPDTAICKGNAVRLHATAGTHYSWTPVEGLSDTIVPNPIATPLTSTVYIVSVTDGSGCIGKASVNVRLRNSTELDARFIAPDYLCRPADTATFINESVGDIVSWNWTFSSNQTSIEKNPPQQRFLIETNIKSYPIRLAVVDTAGCTDTAYRLVNVADNCYIAVPSAFTPNGDGKNDFLFPVNAYKAKQLVFHVFNRHGQLLFEAKDWTKKWDGTVKGIQQDTGVFIWTLDYTEPGGKRISLKGTTTLIR